MANLFTGLFCRALDANRFLESHPRILKVLTPEASHQVRVSRYNPAARSTAYNALKPSKILMPSNSAQDDHERNEVQRQIDESTRVRTAASKPCYGQCRGFDRL